MVVADATTSLILSGTGDVVEPEDGVVGDRFGRHLCARRGARTAGLRSLGAKTSRAAR